MNASAVPDGHSATILRQRRSRVSGFGSSPWMTAYAYGTVAFFSGAVERVLMGNPSSYVGTGESPAVQIVGSSIILIAGGILGWRLLFWPKTHKLLPTTIGLIVTMLCAWVLLSIAWSHDPAISFRRGVAFVGTVLAAWTLAVSIPRDEMFRILGRAAIVFIAASAFLAVTHPQYAFHQAGELGNIEHVGRMRGSFAHKNEFARILALSLLLTAAFGKRAFGSRWVSVGALAAGAVMLALTGSAKVLIAVPIALVAALAVNACRTIVQRVGLLIFIGLPALFLMWGGYVDVLLAELFSALGRDPSMSGRDVIWAAAQRSINDHWAVGQGYAAGWSAQAQHEMQLMESKTEVMTHAHNGYLQTLLDVGVFGLILALAPLSYIVGGVVFSAGGLDKPFTFMAVSFSALFVVLNISGSYLLNHNDIFTFILICTAQWVGQSRRSLRAVLKRRRANAIAGPAELRPAGMPVAAGL